MSRWETLSFERAERANGAITRYTSGDKPQTERVLVGGDEPRFDGDTCWLSHDVLDAYFVTMSDTSDAGTIRHCFTEDEWSVMRHNRSLWTHHIEGHEIIMDKDALTDVPGWVEVGGSFDYMDRKT